MWTDAFDDDSLLVTDVGEPAEQTGHHWSVEHILREVLEDGRIRTVTVA